MTTTYQQYLGIITVNSDSQDFGIDKNTLSINTGDYFIAGHDGETREQLVEVLTNCIQTCPGHGSSNVLYHAANGKVTFELNQAANITFDDSLLGTHLGYSPASLTNALMHCSNVHVTRTWRPSRGLASYPTSLDEGEFLGTVSTSKITRSKDGTVYSVQGTKLRDGVFEYRHLLANEVIRSNATEYVFGDFYDDIVHSGKAIRAYPNRTLNDNSACYHTTFMLPMESEGESDAVEVGAFTDQVGRSKHPWQSLWDVGFRLVKNV